MRLLAGAVLAECPGFAPLHDPSSAGMRRIASSRPRACAALVRVARLRTSFVCAEAPALLSAASRDRLPPSLFCPAMCRPRPPRSPPRAPSRLLLASQLPRHRRRSGRYADLAGPRLPLPALRSARVTERACALASTQLQSSSVTASASLTATQTASETSSVSGTGSVTASSSIVSCGKQCDRVDCRRSC